jgi:hypothetical protein
MPLLLEACPGFQLTWQAHLDWWKGEEPGAYNNTSEFASSLFRSARMLHLHRKNDLTRLSGDFRTVAEYNREIQERRRKHSVRSRVGLVLIFLGFGFQLWATWAR